MLSFLGHWKLCKKVSWRFFGEQFILVLMRFWSKFLLRDFQKKPIIHSVLLPLTRARAAKHEKADTSSSIECKLLENSIIPLSQSPKVERAWFLCKTRPLQNVNLELSGWILNKIALVWLIDITRLMWFKRSHGSRILDKSNQHEWIL